MRVAVNGVVVADEGDDTITIEFYDDNDRKRVVDIILQMEDKPGERYYTVIPHKVSGEEVQAAHDKNREALKLVTHIHLRGTEWDKDKE